MKYEHIYTICEQTTKHISDLTSDSYSIYTPFITMKLYGIPAEWDEEKIEEAIDCEKTTISLGKISGYLVLGQALSLIGGDTLDYCDAADGELENAVSALMERNGPLADDDMNIFYISNAYVSDKDAMALFLEELPDMIFTHLHILPDLIAVSPAPLPHEKSKLEQIQEDLAMIAYHEASKKLNKQIFGEGEKDDVDDDPDSSQLTVSPEQLNIVMGRRNEGDSYPAEFIDKDAWQPFLDAGYEEWRKTRVLYKETI